MHTVEFAYAVGNLVRISNAPDITGRVVGLCIRVWGTTYCVCWWQDGKRFEEWLHDWEIEPAKKQNDNTTETPRPPRNINHSPPMSGAQAPANANGTAARHAAGIARLNAESDAAPTATENATSGSHRRPHDPINLLDHAAHAR